MCALPEKMKLNFKDEEKLLENNKVCINIFCVSIGRQSVNARRSTYWRTVKNNEGPMKSVVHTHETFVCTYYTVKKS
jgi:hypothetical protein